MTNDELRDVVASIVPTANGCWEWPKGRTSRGYGAVNRAGTPRTQVPAHRAVYEMAVGPIPDGMILCHTCDNRACVNPAHMFIGTHRDNLVDMHAKGRWRRLRRATVCGKGLHEFTPENTYWTNLGTRMCRACLLAKRAAAWRASHPTPRALATETHCAHGHPWTEESTYWARGIRNCRICRATVMRDRHRRKRAG